MDITYRLQVKFYFYIKSTNSLSLKILPPSIGMFKGNKTIDVFFEINEFILLISKLKFLLYEYVFTLKPYIFEKIS